MFAPCSWYSAWVIHLLSKLLKDERIEAPIHDMYLRYGFSIILTGNISLCTRLSSCSSLWENPLNILFPPLSTKWDARSFLQSISTFSKASYTRFWMLWPLSWPRSVVLKRTSPAWCCSKVRSTDLPSGRWYLFLSKVPDSSVYELWDLKKQHCSFISRTNSLSNVVVKSIFGLSISMR